MGRCDLMGSGTMRQAEQQPCAGPRHVEKANPRRREDPQVHTASPARKARTSQAEVEEPPPRVRAAHSQRQRVSAPPPSSPAPHLARCRAFLPASFIATSGSRV